jgi:hypothetical protein
MARVMAASSRLLDASMIIIIADDCLMESGERSCCEERMFRWRLHMIASSSALDFMAWSPAALQGSPSAMAKVCSVRTIKDTSKALRV